jgi:hypothetical protein
VPLAHLKIQGNYQLPCEKCGENRIITRQRVLCPNCDNVSVLDTQEVLGNKRKELSIIDSQFLNAINITDYNQTFGSAILNRELAANESIYVTAKRKYAINEWLVYTYLLHNLHFRKKGGVSNFPELVVLSRKIVQYYNEIRSLEQGLAVVIEVEGKESLEWTELEPLSFVPKEAYDSSESQPILNGIPDRDLHRDIVLLQEGLMLPIQDALLSEEISRILRQCYHSRILSFVKGSSQARKFVEISEIISSEGIDYNARLKRDPADQGMFLTDRNGIRLIKQRLWKNFNSADVEWYFKGLSRENSGDRYDLGSSIIARDEQSDIFCLPFYSLKMLSIANMKWVKETDLGRALNFKGGVVEDYFFRFVNAYNISLNHPKTGKPLLRIEHPDNPDIEIADIMGYNDKSVLVLESKFWNAPTLSELEKEFGKFEEKLKYIKSNLKKFGFDEKLKIVPFFYTPFAPYSSWHGITILQSILALGTKMYEIFSVRKVELFKEIPGLERLFDEVSDPAPFPIDASQLIASYKPYQYNIHDGLVLEYDEEEVTVFFDLPVSFEGTFSYFDITSETYCELKRKGVSPGDIIRMITVNLNGTWSLTQLLYFRKIMARLEWESDPQKAAPYRKMISLFRYIEKSRANRQA